jgi:hypothetical protein
MRYSVPMIAKEKRRWAYGLFGLAIGYLAVFYVIPGLLASSDGAAAVRHCVPRHKVGLANGQHEGRRWHIKAYVEKNPDCSYLLLKVEFAPQGELRGSWTGGWGVPGGGHLSPSATIAASDNAGDERRNVGGIVGSRVRSVVLQLSEGGTMVVHPKLPSKELRRRFVWLNGLRYFLRFYPAGKHVKAAKLLDAKGKIITTVHSQEGELEGFMSA